MKSITQKIHNVIAEAFEQVGFDSLNTNDETNPKMHSDAVSSFVMQKTPISDRVSTNRTYNLELDEKSMLLSASFTMSFWRYERAAGQSFPYGDTIRFQKFFNINTRKRDIVRWFASVS